jgi:uncharacterized cupredoxin-like copper-binding protein
VRLRPSRRTVSCALAFAGATVVVAVSAGCGDQLGAGGSGTAVAQVTERDFHISAPKRLPAGDVTFRVHNRGPGSHELIVIRLPDRGLPFRADGLTIDEDAVAKVEAGALEPAHAGVVRTLRLHLTPGRYVLLCNMYGHYLGGMHTTVVVS